MRVLAYEALEVLRMFEVVSFLKREFKSEWPR